MSVAMERAKESCHRVGAASSVASAIPRPVEVAGVEGAARRGAGAEEQEYEEASPKQILEEMRARVSPSMVWPSSKEMWDEMLKNTSPLPPLVGPSTFMQALLENTSPLPPVVGGDGDVMELLKGIEAKWGGGVVVPEAAAAAASAGALVADGEEEDDGEGSYTIRRNAVSDDEIWAREEEEGEAP